MATDLFQGSALPSTVSTTQAQTTLPDFYTNYLQDITNLGQNAVNQGGVAGASPLQQQAYQMAPQTAFSGAGTAGTAADLLTSAGTTSSPDVVNNYMNPYTSNVVNEMARLSNQNVQRNIMPALASAGVGTGSFGSKRQANATGQTLADIQGALTGQQYGALNAGYSDAMKNAQADLTRELQAGQGLTQTAQEQNNIGITGLKSLSDLGSQQQTTAQNLLNYPMAAAQNYAKLMQGYTMPTGTTTQAVAPGTQGQFSNSPLSQIAGLGTLLGSLFGNSSSTAPATTTGGTAPTGTVSTSYGAIPQAVIDQLTAAAPDALNSIRTVLGFADGGGVQGGLQSMLQGETNQPSQNLNIPQPSNSLNPNIPVGGNPSLVPSPLNQPLNRGMNDSQGGSVGGDQFNPMVG